jgi:hypothetical protein
MQKACLHRRAFFIYVVVSKPKKNCHSSKKGYCLACQTRFEYFGGLQYGWISNARRKTVFDESKKATRKGSFLYSRNIISYLNLGHFKPTFKM